MSDAAGYFALDPSARETSAKGTWFDLHGDVTPLELMPGLEFRPVIGTKLAINLVTFEPHTEAPVHAHDEEQISLVLEGECEFEVNGEKRTLRPGMAVVIPPNAPHGARTFDSRCVALDIFHPPRKMLLDALSRGTPNR